MNVAGTLSPGNSPGTLSSGSQSWLDGGDYNWQILDADGVAGVGYDTLSITGTLDLTAITTGGFGINLWSLASILPDVNGNALNFSELLNYSWILATTTTGITGFDAADFVLNTAASNGTAGFINTYTGGFSVAQSGNQLLLNYSAVPEPNPAMLLRPGYGRPASSQAERIVCFRSDWLFLPGAEPSTEVEGFEFFLDGIAKWFPPSLKKLEHVERLSVFQSGIGDPSCITSESHLT